MRFLLRFRAVLVVVALWGCLIPLSVRGQANQWVSLNGELSGGAYQIIVTPERAYFYGSSIVSYSTKEGWRLFFQNIGTTNVLVAPDGKILDDGSMISGEPPQLQLLPITKFHSYDYAIDSSGGLYAVGGAGIGYSRDWLTGWRYHDTVFHIIPEVQVAKTGEVLMMSPSGILLSIDSAQTWVHLLDTTSPYPQPHSLDVSNKFVWFATFGSLGRHASRDRGKMWTIDTSGPVGMNSIRWRSEVEGYASTPNGIFVTRDTGKTWQRVLGAPGSATIGLGADSIYLFSNNFVYARTYSGSKWDSVGPLAYEGGGVRGIYRDPASHTILVAGNGVISYSSDTGFSWHKGMKFTFASDFYPSFLPTSHGLFFYSYGGVPLRSTDDGVTWHRTTGWIGDTAILSMTELPSGDMFAVNGTAIYRSSDGITWGLTDQSNNFVTIGCDPSGRLFAGTTETTFLNPGTIYRSTDNGLQWQKLAVEMYSSHNIHADDQSVYVSTDEGLYRSNDHGDTWTFFDSSKTENVFDAIPIGTNSYATITDFRVKLFPNGADTIDEQPQNIYCMFSDPQSHIMYVAGSTGIERSTTPIWYGPLRVASASSSQDHDIVMADAQSITVRYDLTEPEDVRLTLRDILGRDVSQLRLGLQSPASHEALIETSSLPRGAYFLEIAKGERTSVHSVAVFR